MSTKQLVFIDTTQHQNSGTFERFHAEGVQMHTDQSIRISESTSNNAMVLDVYGHVLADKLRGRSDARLKKNITDIGSGIDLIRNLCGKMYQLRDHASDVSYGLIAQEVQSVIPSIVHTDCDGYLNISYIELIPIMIESIKELDAKMEKLLNILA